MDYKKGLSFFLFIIVSLGLIYLLAADNTSRRTTSERTTQPQVSNLDELEIEPTSPSLKYREKDSPSSSQHNINNTDNVTELRSPNFVSGERLSLIKKQESRKRFHSLIHEYNLPIDLDSVNQPPEDAAYLSLSEYIFHELPFDQLVLLAQKVRYTDSALERTRKTLLSSSTSKDESDVRSGSPSVLKQPLVRLTNISTKSDQPRKTDSSVFGSSFEIHSAQQNDAVQLCLNLARHILNRYLKP